jgi:FAD/FMN-containing dehydrogenase
MRLEGWGRFPHYDACVSAPRSEKDIRDQLAAGTVIARGNGRAYGDSAINTRNTLSMRHFNHMLAFEEKTGQLTVEAGVLLADVIKAFLPRGWFPSVTPGTQFVTIGGMIAADVHGKNHHKHGSFGNFVNWIDLLGADGETVRCSPIEHADLFEWTIGGMGLTGIILRAAIRLKPVETGWIKQKTISAPDLNAAIEVFEKSQDANYSVAWIDCLSTGAALGRSLVMLGEHATRNDLPDQKREIPYYTGHKRNISMPFYVPSFLLNSVTVRGFNALYYWSGSRKVGTSLVDWGSYFYPLDAILGWNKMYGRKGFSQFQCVLPLDTSKDGLKELLRAVSNAGQGSFLAVLKRFGEQNSRFSFPMEGYTLALDFPISPNSLAIMDQLDRITIEHGGRFYLAKDSRMTADTLRNSDCRTQEFVQMRQTSKLQSRFASAQSERLGI